MDPKAKKSIFLGYGIGVKGYRLFDTDTSKVFHSRDVIFNETASISEKRTEEVENQPLVEVECENINSDDDECWVSPTVFHTMNKSICDI